MYQVPRLPASEVLSSSPYRYNVYFIPLL